MKGICASIVKWFDWNVQKRFLALAISHLRLKCCTSKTSERLANNVIVVNVL